MLRLNVNKLRVSRRQGAILGSLAKRPLATAGNQTPESKGPSVVPSTPKTEPKQTVVTPIVNKPESSKNPNSSSLQKGPNSETSGGSNFARTFKRTVYTTGFLSVAAFAGALYYASQDDDFKLLMTKYIPVTPTLLQYSKYLSDSVTGTQQVDKPINTPKVKTTKPSVTLPPPLAKDAHQTSPSQSGLFNPKSSSSSPSDSSSKQLSTPTAPTTLPKQTADLDVIEPQTQSSPKSQLSDLAPEVENVVAVASTDHPAHPSISSLYQSIERLSSLLSATARTTPSILPTVNKIKEIIESTKQDLARLDLDFEVLTEDEEIIVNAILVNQAESLKQALADQAEKFRHTMSEEKAKLQSDAELETKRLLSELETSHKDELRKREDTFDEKLKTALHSQAKELQSRWNREVKAQLDRERNGRLAKLDHLSLKLKYLEKLVFANAERLYNSYHVHHLFSALQALQTTLFEEPGHDHIKHSFQKEWQFIRKLSLHDPLIQSVLDTITENTTKNGIESIPNLHARFTRQIRPEIRKAALMPSSETRSVYKLASDYIRPYFKLPKLSEEDKLTSYQSPLPPIGFVSYTLSSLLSHFLITKPPGLYPNQNDIESILARVEFHLEREDLDSATRELNQLNGWPKELCKDWLKDARSYLEVKQAVEILTAQVGLMSLGAI
ncbi:mitochondrial inner membrane protein-domain-containing protein [Paraphysoderma sedebokerense]|nr:mitochondrial inner membrane protein-domain-containing protein [Paraphysoderma sedebokerense]